MLIKMRLSYLLLFTTMLGSGVIMTLGDVEIPKWFSIFFGLLIVLFPLLLVAAGFYWIWK